MSRVLLVGFEPDAVDYSDPALPPGLTAQQIQAKLDLGLKLMKDRGWQAEMCLIRPDATATAMIEKRLGSTTYDCIVIGAGVRLPPKGLKIFEVILNAVHKAAPDAAIAFNSTPEDSAEAAARWVSGASATPAGGG